jgi:hypothetical protein
MTSPVAPHGHGQVPRELGCPPLRSLLAAGGENPMAIDRGGGVGQAA